MAVSLWSLPIGPIWPCLHNSPLNQQQQHSALSKTCHARAVVDALLGRLAPATSEIGRSPATKESKLARKKPEPLRSSPRRNPSLANLERRAPNPRRPAPGAAHRPNCSTQSGEGEEP